MEKNIVTFIAQSIKIPSSSVNLPNISASDATWATLTGTAFIAIGAMATLFLVIGAITYITSNGDQGAIQKAKNTILYAIVGIVVSAFAFTIVQFVLGKLVL